MVEGFPTLIVNDYVQTNYSASVLAQVDVAFQFIADERVKYQKFFNEQKKVWINQFSYLRATKRIMASLPIR